MSDELQLISDGEGLAVLGEPRQVEAFLASEGLMGSVELPQASRIMALGGAGVEAGSHVVATSGRWLKLTPESAKKVKDLGLMDTKTQGVKHAMIGKPGNVKSWLQVSDGPRSLATNPAVLSGAAGVMTQLAMQQAMSEITDYLAKIDQKLDDVLRAQTDAVLADVVGVGLAVEEALAIRAEVGRVSEVTWSKVQTSAMTIARTQAYASSQIQAITRRLEQDAGFGDMADAAEEAGAKIYEWLSVLARCAQLQDAVAILELDRVLDADPDELDRHRIALGVARRQRMELIQRVTDGLVARLDAAAERANDKVLTHPAKSPAVVRARNDVAAAVRQLDEHLGLERERDAVDSRRWIEAAADVKDRTLDSGARGVVVARREGGKALGRARSVTGKVAGSVKRVAERRDTDAEELPAGK